MHTDVNRESAPEMRGHDTQFGSESVALRGAVRRIEFMSPHLARAAIKRH